MKLSLTRNALSSKQNHMFPHSINRHLLRLICSTTHTISSGLNQVEEPSQKWSNYNFSLGAFHFRHFSIYFGLKWARAEKSLAKSKAKRWQLNSSTMGNKFKSSMISCLDLACIFILRSKRHQRTVHRNKWFFVIASLKTSSHAFRLVITIDSYFFFIYISLVHSIVTLDACSMLHRDRPECPLRWL